MPPEVPVKKLRHHVFVCLNERPAGHPRGCCKSRGAEELLQAFKTEVARAGLSAEVRAQKAGCLDTCERGPSVVVYPEGVWYARVAPADAAEIVKSHLVEGRPVERLRMDGK
jgi:(2Fe-2S) ferredoxin